MTVYQAILTMVRPIVKTVVRLVLLVLHSQIIALLVLAHQQDNLLLRALVSMVILKLVLRTAPYATIIVVTAV